MDQYVGGPEYSHQSICNLYNYINNLEVKQKKEIFKILRTNPFANEDSFLCKYGITAGEFAIFHILTEKGRKDETSKMK